MLLPIETRSAPTQTSLKKVPISTSHERGISHEQSSLTYSIFRTWSQSVRKLRIREPQTVKSTLKQRRPTTLIRELCGFVTRAGEHTLFHNLPDAYTEPQRF